MLDQKLRVSDGFLCARGNSEEFLEHLSLSLWVTRMAAEGISLLLAFVPNGLRKIMVRVVDSTDVVLLLILCLAGGEDPSKKHLHRESDIIAGLVGAFLAD